MVLDQYVTGRPWYVAGRTVPLDGQACPPEVVHDIRNALGPQVADLYLTRWGAIQSHFWEATRGLRSAYNFRTSIGCSMDDLRAFFRHVSERCTLPFRANVSVSSILRAKKPDQNGEHALRFYHGSEQNGALLEIPMAVHEVEDLEALVVDVGAGPTSDLFDIQSDAWGRVMLTSIAVYLHHIVLGGETDAGDEARGPERQVSEVKIEWQYFGIRRNNIFGIRRNSIYIPKCIIMYITKCICIYHYAFNEFPTFCVIFFSVVYSRCQVKKTCVSSVVSPRSTTHRMLRPPLRGHAAGGHHSMDPWQVV